MQEQSELQRLPEGVAAADCTKTGYEALIRFESWRTAFITYSELFDEKTINKLERHMKTDEVFLLLTGTATLLIGEDGTKVTMEPWKFYNVTCKTWHNIYVEPGTKVAICENADTGRDNTEYMELHR